MNSSSSASSILRQHDKNQVGIMPSPLRRSSSSSVTVLHQTQLPSYSAERFFILSELQLHSVPPTFLADSQVDDNTTAVTAELSFEGSQEASTLLPLQPYSILYLIWKPDFGTHGAAVDASAAFCHEVIMPAVHKVQGITQIRQPSLGQRSSSSSLSRCESDDDSNDENSLSANHVDRVPSVSCTRLYLVVDQVCDDSVAPTAGEDAHFETLQEYGSALARLVSTELRGLVQGISVGVSNQEKAVPGLEACMNAILVGSQDRRRYGSSTAEEGKKSLIGLISESYADLAGPEDAHHHHHQHQHASEEVPPTQVRQCLVIAEWSAAGDLATFANRAHAVWRDQHQLPALPSRSSRKKLARRSRVVELTPAQTRADLLYHCMVLSVLALYFYFHYRQVVVDLASYVL